MSSRQSGAVSLFVVIFTAILVTVVTIGFTQIMLRNQQQTTETDLSQSAYDSALAGVEDGKRLLIRLAECDQNGEACTQLRDAVQDQDCSTVDAAGLANVGGQFDQQVGDEELDQSYTCVKIITNTPTIDGTLSSEENTVVPLRGESSFNRVRVSWFTREDATGSDGNLPPSGPTIPFFTTVDNPNGLPPSNRWTQATPPVLRMQYINANRTMSQLSNAAGTVVGYPADSTGVSSVNVDNDNRRDSTVTPTAVACESSFSAAPLGVCSVDLRLPEAVGANRTAYLELQSQYNATHFTVELYQGSNNRVLFDGVQPIVDSTGRANSLFRRVKARVKITNGQSLPYPSATVGVSKNLCKTLFVAAEGSDYNPGACDPTKSSLD